MCADCWEIGSKPLDLLGVEHAVALEERDFALDILAGLSLTLRARDRVGVDHEAALFALAGMRVQLKRLFERHPDRRRETLLHGRRPEHEDVDPGVRLPGVAQGPRDLSCRVLGIPMLSPRPDALFQ
jgi:hypothetical protein